MITKFELRMPPSILLFELKINDRLNAIKLETRLCVRHRIGYL
jgi:hypothetical protein